MSSRDPYAPSPHVAQAVDGPVDAESLGDAVTGQDYGTPPTSPEPAGGAQIEAGAVSGDSVPDLADEVTAWVLEADGEGRHDRATAAKAAEMDRAPSQRRKTVLALVNDLLGLAEDDGLPE